MATGLGELHMIVTAVCVHTHMAGPAFDMRLAMVSYLARLETRTKESNACVSVWLLQPGCENDLAVGMCALLAGQLTVKGLSLNMCFRTRKMVSYAWAI